MSNNPNTTEKAIVQTVLEDNKIIYLQTRINEVLAIRNAVFQKGIHYGPPYKGAKNDTLLKPGATFLQQKYGMRPEFERMERVIHVEMDDLSKSYVIVQWRCRIVDSETGKEISQAVADCTSFEDKYLYRQGNLICPDCEKETIRKSKDNSRPGYYCWQKLDPEACGHKFAIDDVKITGQEVGKVRNENPLNLLDTLDAMAQKRAEIRATIRATGVDVLFSPGDGIGAKYYDDIEVVEGEFEEIVEKPTIIEHNGKKVDTRTGEILNTDAAKAALGTPSGQRVETGDDILPATPNLQPATVTKVSVKPTGEGKRKELILTMDDSKIGMVRAYSRKLFIDAGWIDDSQWTDEGMIELTPPIPVMLKRDAKTGRYWELAEVVKPVNPFLEKAAS